MVCTSAVPGKGGVRTSRAYRLGFNVFKIAKTALASPFVPGSVSFDASDNELLTQYCITELWTGDLSNGLFRLGEKAARMHGLEQRDCGLLNLIRRYDPLDRAHVLELFEQAATTSSSFCFSTTIESDGALRQPLFCVGESTGLEQRYAGAIIGLFIFPRFRTDHAAAPAPMAQ
jgi:hypothetical protein